MASNKNQHFVPRCHLRPFTKDEADAAICVFNIDRQKFIVNAPVKNQCSGDYFYGKNDSLERAIQLVESAYGKVIRELRMPRYILTEDAKTVLRRFWLLQYMRTEAASRRTVEMAIESDRVAGIEAFSFRFDVQRAVQFAMLTYAKTMDVIDDLKICLIRNRTSVPFVTSDDPAVLTNRWYLEDRRIRGRSFGWQASGLLAILPLTPRILCLAYDGDVYNVQHQSGWADIRNEADARALNQHQFLNCFANIFLHDPAFAEEIQSSFVAINACRPAVRHAVHIAVLDRTEGNYSRYRVVSPEEARNHHDLLLHSEMLFPTPTVWPSILRWRRGGSVYTNGTGIKYVRKFYALTLQSHREFWRESIR